MVKIAGFRVVIGGCLTVSILCSFVHFVLWEETTVTVKTLHWLHSSSGLRTEICQEGLQKRPALIKQNYSPAALQGYWVVSCILLVEPGYQGRTGKSTGRADKQQTRRPELVPAINQAIDFCPSACSRALGDDAGAANQGIFNWRDFLKPDNGTIHRLELEALLLLPFTFPQLTSLKQMSGKPLIKCYRAVADISSKNKCTLTPYLPGKSNKIGWAGRWFSILVYWSSWTSYHDVILCYCSTNSH